MARTAPVPNIPPILGMCPSIAVAGGGGDGGGSSGGSGGDGNGNGPGNGGDGGDGAGGDGTEAPDPVKYPLCGTKSHPVDVVTGRAFTHPVVDFEIEGIVPVRFRRSASSKIYRRDFGMGVSWGHTFGWTIEIRRQSIWVFTELGTKIAFPLVEIGHQALGPFGWKLKRDQAGYEVDADDDLFRRFDRSLDERMLLTEIRDRNDNKITLSYSARGALERVVDSGNREIKVQTDANAHITGFLLDTGNGQWLTLARYEYDDRGRLVAASDPDGYSHAYAYNDRGQLTLDKNRVGLQFHFVFDEKGRCTESWGDYGDKPDPSLAEKLPEFLHDGVTRCKGIHHCLFEWGPGGYSVVTDTTQSSNCFGNEFGLLDKMVEGGTTITATYRGDGHLMTLSDGSGATTTYERDARGRVIRVTDPLGRSVTIERDGYGMPLRMIDPAGAETIYARDYRGNLLHSRDAAGGLTQYTRDERGLVTKVVDKRNGRREAEWDARGNLTSVTESNGARWRYAYDALGRRIASNDPFDRSTRYRYSNRGDLVAVEDALGGATRYSYDGEGHVTRMVTPEGYPTELHWGGYNKLVRRVDANGQQVRLGYNSEGELTHIWNERGELDRLYYSASGVLTREETFDGRVHTIRRDAQGRPISIRNGSREMTEMKYDLAGQLVARKLHDDTEEIYEYGLRGELRAVKSPRVELRFEHDVLGRVVREVQTLAGVTHSVDVEYDQAGARIGRKTSLGHVESIARGALGERRETTLDGNTVRHMTDIVGRELHRALPSGGAIETKFDPLGRIEERSAVGPSREFAIPMPGEPEWIGERRSNVTAFKAFRYDADGVLVVASDRDRGRVEYRYDPVGHMLSRLPERARAEVFRYDPTGNIHEGDAAAKERVYGKGNRLLKKGDTKYVWDGEGRLLEKRMLRDDPTLPEIVWRYSWNAAGLLAEVKRDDGVSVSFAYDPFARRLEKTVYKQPTALERPRVQSRTRFVWDGDTLVHEIRADARAAGDPVVEERTYCFDDDSFEPLAHRRLTKGETDESGWFHYLNDPSGTPDRLIADDGTVAATYDRPAWGGLTRVEGSKADTPLRMQGQYWDEETGLAYNRWRYYDADTGTFVSADPIGLRGGIHGYGFAANTNSWTDPFGLVKAPSTLPNSPGIYILTNDTLGEAYVGSAGIGSQGMYGRISSSGHEHAQHLLNHPDTKVKFVRVCLDEANVTDVSDRNNILRHYENREYEKTKAKGYTMLNETGIQDPDKKAYTEGLITSYGLGSGGAHPTSSRSRTAKR